MSRKIQEHRLWMWILEARELVLISVPAWRFLLLPVVSERAQQLTSGESDHTVNSAWCVCVCAPQCARDSPCGAAQHSTAHTRESTSVVVPMFEHGPNM